MSIPHTHNIVWHVVWNRIVVELHDFVLEHAAVVAEVGAAAVGGVRPHVVPLLVLALELINVQDAVHIAAQGRRGLVLQFLVSFTENCQLNAKLLCICPVCKRLNIWSH